jgi:hypothetical protein
VADRGRPRRVRVGPRRAPSLPAGASLSRRAEALLVQVIVALGVLIVLTQLLLTVPAARYVMSYVNRLEGVALGPGGASVTVALESGTPAKAAWLLLNGRRAADFALGSVRVQVKAGDSLEVDGTSLAGDGRFTVLLTAGGVAVPAAGLSVTTHGDVVPFGRVTFQTGPGGS